MRAGRQAGESEVEGRLRAGLVRERRREFGGVLVSVSFGWQVVDKLTLFALK